MATRDRVAFITGANRGSAWRRHAGLGELGIAVVLGSRDEAKGRAAAETLEAEGIKGRRGRQVRRQRSRRITRRSPGSWKTATASSTSW